MTQAQKTPASTKTPTPAPTQDSGSGSSSTATKSKAKGSSYEEGAALVAPGGANAQGGGGPSPAPTTTPAPAAKASGSAGSFAALAQTVKSIAGTVVTGKFANVNINCAFPVAAVPGLSITVGVSGSIACGSDKQKEFNLQLSGGAQYGLGKIFNINAAVSGALSLKGEDLGAALVDALKQTLHLALVGAGVDRKLNEAHQSLNNPKTRTERLIAWGVGEDWINSFNTAYAGYFTFFKNNGAVGFEASVGISVGVGASAGNKALGASLEARTGIEDVDNKEAVTFAEIAGQVQANSGNNAASVRFSKRSRGNGSSTVAVEINGQLSMPRKAFEVGGMTAKGIFQNGMFLAKIGSVVMAMNEAKKGMNVSSATGLAAAACNLGTATFGSSEHFDSLMGIEIKVSKTNGVWTCERARLKSMTQIGTGTGQSVGGVEANVQVGTFIDVTNTILEGIKLLGSEPPKDQAKT